MTPDTPSQEIEATLRFRFAGEAVTQIARNHVAAGDWELGLRLLTEGVRGLGYSNAVAILRGELALEGVNTVGLVQQDPEAEGFAAWQQQVQYAYAGRFRLRGVWYRPYAVVENYGQQDAAWSAKRWGLKGDMARAPGNNRALYYANDPEADLALTMDYPGWMGLTTAMRVLFEVCTSPPVWMQHARTAEEALSAYVHVRGYTLERRSWSERHGAMDSEVRELYAQQRAYMLRREAEIDLIRGRTGYGAVAFVELPEEPEEPEDDTAQIAAYREQIVARADAMGAEGWLDLPPYQGHPGLRVPRAPFLHWALARTHGAHLAPSWHPVCPSGLKRGVDDDPYHTDWVVGASIAPDTAYQPDIRDVSVHAMGEIQERMLGFKATVLAGRGRVSGRVVHPEEGQELAHDEIAVIPTARPGYEAAVCTAAAVITGTGGELCHLANVAREGRGRIVRVVDCMTLYLQGIRVTVDCDAGTVEISDVR